MSGPSVLGEFEQLILLAVIRLGEGAYGVSVRREIEFYAERQVSPGALYTSLERLETKGNLISREGEASPVRGGRAFSAWPLRFMNHLQDAYGGWAWSMCSWLGLIALTSWLVTASSTLRLGMAHKLTHCSLTFSVALSLLSTFMLQPDLRRVSPVLVAAFLVWRLRISGLPTTLSCLVATGFTVRSLWELFTTVRTGRYMRAW